MLKSIFLFIFLLYISLAHSQSERGEVINDAQFWLDYNSKYNFDETRSISGFGGYRTTNPRLYDKIMLVSSYNIINTKSPKFMNLKKPLINSFHLGTGIYYTKNIDSEDNLELRLMQGFKFFLPSIKYIPLKSYIRLEERFQKTFNGSNWDTAFRLRFKLSTVIEWKKRLFSFNKGLYLPMSIEAFSNLTKSDQFNDVIRISPGIGYKFNDEWKAELFLSYHYTLNTTANENSSNDFVFRLRIYRENVKKAKVIDTKEEEIKELIE